MKMEGEPAPPRIRHNSELAAMLIYEKKITCRYPKVTDQVETLPIERDKLAKYGYNPSMVEDNGRLLFAYRWHDGKTLHSDLALASLDMSGKVLHNEKVQLGAGGEDPKLFKVLGLPYLSWVESTFPVAPFKSVVRSALLDVYKLTRQCTPKLPGNDFTTMQKNWVCFGHGLEFYCIYQCSPTHHVFQLNWEEPVMDWETPGPQWAYGQIRGGTPPIPYYKGGLLRFFHSGLDNEYGQYRRRYFMGAYVMEEKPPFAVLEVSKKPIVYGSELDNLKRVDREACPQYKKQVVFPGGAVPTNGGWLVAIGVNDSACEILKITPDQLNL